MWHWLVTQGHLYNALVGWTVGVTMTSGVVAMIVKPGIRKMKEEWRKHETTQLQIADRLDPTTPGGIAALIQKSQGDRE